MISLPMFRPSRSSIRSRRFPNPRCRPSPRLSHRPSPRLSRVSRSRRSSTIRRASSRLPLSCRNGICRLRPSLRSKRRPTRLSFRSTISWQMRFRPKRRSPKPSLRHRRHRPKIGPMSRSTICSATLRPTSPNRRSRRLRKRTSQRLPRSWCLKCRSKCRLPWRKNPRRRASPIGTPSPIYRASRLLRLRLPRFRSRKRPPSNCRSTKPSPPRRPKTCSPSPTSPPSVRRRKEFPSDIKTTRSASPPKHRPRSFPKRLLL